MPEKTEIDAIARKRQRKSPWIWIILVALVAAAAAVWYWQGASGESGAVRYTTTPATRADIIVTITATGTVEPINTVEISSELSGTVRTVTADFNDEVKVGDVLATLDTDKLEANVEQVTASLTAAKANLVEAEVTLEEQTEAYDRAVRLSEQGISSQETLLTAKARLPARGGGRSTPPRPNVKVAEANLKLAETNLDKACICSPINGIVLDRAVEVGQIVAASLSAPTLFTLAEDLKHMNLTVDIDEADIGQVAVGNKATFTVEAYQNREFEAEITQLRFAPENGPKALSPTRAFLDVDNENLLLRPGMTATAEITVAELADVLTVPNAALRFSPPVQTEQQEESASGLLGMLMPHRPSSNGGAPAVDAEGMRSIWVLRDKRAGGSQGAHRQQRRFAHADPGRRD